MDNKKYETMIHKLAIKYNKPPYVIKKIVESQFEFIYNTIKDLDFKSIKSKEEFDKLKKNFNVKYLFTLSANYKTLENINKRKNESKSPNNK